MNDPRIKCPHCGVELDEKHVRALRGALEVNIALSGWVTDVSSRDFLCPDCFDRIDDEGNVIDETQA